MSKNYELAKIDYDNGMKYKEIAQKYGVTINTVKSWKTRKWNKDAEEKSVHTKQKSVHTKKEAPESKGNSDRERIGERAKGGNPNPSYKFPKHNKAAEKHGFYSRMIPDDMQDIFAELDESISMLDMLWDNIKIQYMAIMRAQRIMFVESKEEMIKELKKAKYEMQEDEYGEQQRVVIEEEFEFQFAWERQAQFLTAQSRAIAELRSSIEKFMELSDKTDERRLKLEKMAADIDKTHAMTDKIRSDMTKDEVKKIEIEIRGVGEDDD